MIVNISFLGMLDEEIQQIFDKMPGNSPHTETPLMQRHQSAKSLPVHIAHFYGGNVSNLELQESSHIVQNLHEQTLKPQTSVWSSTPNIQDRYRRSEE